MSKRDRHGQGQEDEEPRGNGKGRERAVYEEYLARKWHGSAPPTPQDYARSIRLWRQLPGSIMTTPSDLGTIPEPEPNQVANDPSQKDEDGKDGTGHES